MQRCISRRTRCALLLHTLATQPAPRSHPDATNTVFAPKFMSTIPMSSRTIITSTRAHEGKRTEPWPISDHVLPAVTGKGREKLRPFVFVGACSMQERGTQAKTCTPHCHRCRISHDASQPPLHPRIPAPHANGNITSSTRTQHHHI